MAEIEFVHVSKSYGDTPAVRDLNLKVGEGEFVVLVGPSGCGKTTALRMVAGLEEITEGEIRIGDRVVNELAPRDRPRAEGVPDGRAALQPRRQAARADARGDRANPEGVGSDDALRHARPGRGDDDGRPRRRDARRHPAAGRHAPAPV